MGCDTAEVLGAVLSADATTTCAARSMFSVIFTVALSALIVIHVSVLRLTARRKIAIRNVSCGKDFCRLLKDWCCGSV